MHDFSERYKYAKFSSTQVCPQTPPSGWRPSVPEKFWHLQFGRKVLDGHFLNPGYKPGCTVHGLLVGMPLQVECFYNWSSSCIVQNARYFSGIYVSLNGLPVNRILKDVLYGESLLLEAEYLCVQGLDVLQDQLYIHNKGVQTLVFLLWLQLKLQHIYKSNIWLCPMALAPVKHC